MQREAIMEAGMLVRHEAPLLKRFLAKLLVDVLPATFVSVLGGFIITQYQFAHSVMQRPATVQVVPASTEMMQLVRDEHAVIIDYLKTQLAEEKSRHAAEDAADAHARAAAVHDAEAATTEPVPAAAPMPPARPAAVAVRPARTRSAMASTTLPPHAPLVIAQAEQPAAVMPIASAPAEPKSLLTRTIEIKDHVVGATLHAVSAIGSIPSWIADRIGGETTTSPVAPAPRQFTTS
jgi:hypothetical protein